MASWGMRGEGDVGFKCPLLIWLFCAAQYFMPFVIVSPLSVVCRVAEDWC